MKSFTQSLVLYASKTWIKSTGNKRKLKSVLQKYPEDQVNWQDNKRRGLEKRAWKRKRLGIT